MAGGLALSIGVMCQDDNPMIVIAFRGGDGIFADGEIDAWFDADPVDQYSLLDRNNALIGVSPLHPWVSLFVSNLRVRNVLFLRVTKWRAESLSEVIPLSGAATAIDQLPCR